MESAATLSVVATFTLILDGLLTAIGARIADYPFTAEMVTFLWKRVNTVKNRFLALAAGIQAGRIPREPAEKPRAGRRSGTAWPDGINWRKWLPMGRFAWLCWLMPSLANRFGAAQFADPLRHLLGEPEMRTLLSATPKTARLLAPLCFMLGIDESLLRPVFAAPSMATPTPDIVSSEPAAAPPENAEQPHFLDDAHPITPDQPPRTGAEFLFSA
jgi:hypothetical protein